MRSPKALLIITLIFSSLPSFAGAKEMIERDAEAAKPYIQDIKSKLEDPNGFQIIEVVTVGMAPANDTIPSFDISSEDVFTVCVIFRAKNRMGGYVTAKGFADSKSDVSIFSSDSDRPEEWKRRCQSPAIQKWDVTNLLVPKSDKGGVQ